MSAFIPEITFETKCYENDWQFLLKTNYLNQMIQNCHIPFTHRHIIINNVNNRSIVEKYARKKLSQGVIDAYYFAEDYAEEALSSYQLNKNCFGKGYYYSISELVGIFLTKTKYLLHFSSDAIIDKKESSEWIYKACALMETNTQYIVANPCWNYNYNQAQAESIAHTDDFFIGYGFSDQCYLIRTNDFKHPIYNYSHQDSDRYPTYGGQLFEKRVDSYMRTKHLLRLTSTQTSYIHKNFSKKHKIILFILIQLNLFNTIKKRKRLNNIAYKQSKLALFFLDNPFYPVHLQKDVGLFPLYLKRKYFDAADIIKIGDRGGQTNRYDCSELTVIDLFNAPQIYQSKFKINYLYICKCIFKSIWYIFKHRNITHVMVFHAKRLCLGICFFIKLVFPKIKTYVKCDVSIQSIKNYPCFIRPKTIKQCIQKLLYNSIDLFTVETTDVFNALRANPFFYTRNIQLVPNGLDDDYAAEIDFAHKQKTIITVGRLGSYQKNTELLLNVVSQLNLHDWQVIFIGPLETEEQNFQSYINVFFNQFPALSKQITFTGSITNQTILQHEYTSASVFVFSSRFESFGISLLEAAGAGCYIVSTDVGAAADITQQGTLGFICKQSKQGTQDENAIQLQITEHLQQIIDGRIDISQKQRKQSEYVRTHFMMKNIVTAGCFKEWTAN